MSERTQPKNPYGLTVNQHIHSKYSISKFAANNRKVEVRVKATGKVLKLKPSNKFFCANRVWDQKSESVFMKNIEDEYHREIDRIIQTGNVSNHKVISDYFLLWRIRYDISRDPKTDVTFNGITGSDLTKDQEEVLEKKGYMFNRVGGIMPARFVNGITLFGQFSHDRPQIDDWKWGVLTATQGEFVVADCYKTTVLFPITPNLLLSPAQGNTLLDEHGVREANKTSVREATDFYFCRNFDNTLL